MLFPDPADRLDGPELSDAETRAQVVERAKRIVRVAGLQEVSGSFRFGACSTPVRAPYRGRVSIRFALPPDADPDAYVQQVAAKMVADGWTDGPPPGLNPYGLVVHQGPVMALLSPHRNIPGNGSIRLIGDCRNLTDQLAIDGTVPQRITEELRSAG